MTFDLDAALRVQMQQLWNESTWDKTALHLSDLSLCERAVWARRNGHSSVVLSVDHFIKRQFTLRYGQLIHEMLTAQGVPHEYRQSFEIVLLGVPIVGTATFVLPREDAILEIKTTTFWSGWVGAGAQKHKTTRIPDTPRYGYRLVAAAHALALGKAHYGINTLCRGTGLRTTSWYKAEHLVTQVGRALAERERTGCGMPENKSALPPAYTYSADGTSQQCLRCSYVACENNNNEKLKGLK